MDAELMTFSVGQKLKIIPERRGSWMPEEVEVAEVFDHKRVVPGVGHQYSIKTTNGEVYSGWWFDPNAPMAPSDDYYCDDYYCYDYLSHD